MQRSKEFWIVVIVFLICIAGIAYIFVGESPTVATPKPPDTALVNFTGADLHESKDGKVIWTLKAKEIKYNPKTKDVFLTDVEGTFNKDGQVLTVKAPEATVTNEQKVISLKGKIDGQSTDGMKFEGLDLVFNNETKQFETLHPFTYRRGDTTITGDTLSGDIILQKINASGHVKLLKGATE